MRKSFWQKKLSSILLLLTVFFHTGSAYALNSAEGCFYDIDNNSRLSLGDLIFGLNILTGSVNNATITAEINETVMNYVAAVRSNNAALTSADLEPFFHTNYVDEGMSRTLFLAKTADDLRGENPPANFIALDVVTEINLSAMTATAIMVSNDGDSWTEVFKKDITTGKWLIYSEQPVYVYNVHFGISKNYSATSPNGSNTYKGVWVGVHTWDKVLAHVYVVGSIFTSPEEVNLVYTESKDFYYTPTESITADHRYYEFYSSSFGEFPSESAVFVLAVDDGIDVEAFTARSNNAITTETLTGIGPTDYAIGSVKGQTIPFSVTSPSTFTTANIEWVWRANEIGPWFPADQVDGTTATFTFPTIDVEGQDINRIMLQARTVGTNGEESVVYWMYGFSY